MGVDMDDSLRGIRCVQLLGAPGCGKSTNLYGIMYHLKLAGLPVECVDEHDTKVHVLQKKPFGPATQLGFFRRQQEKHIDFHDYGDVLTVTDSSPYLSYLHGAFYESKTPEVVALLRRQAMQFEEKYPSLMIYIRRTDEIPYARLARFQDEDESARFGEFQLECLKRDFPGRYLVFSTTDTLGMVEAIKKVWFATKAM